MSVTVPIVPSLVPDPFVKVTVRPPEVSALPAASLARSVSCAVVLINTLADETSTTLVVTDAGPGIVVMVGSVDVIAVPLTVTLIVRGDPVVVAAKVVV